MNYISAKNGNRVQNAVARSVAHHCIDKLMPRMRTLDISILFKKIPEKENTIGVKEDSKNDEVTNRLINHFGNDKTKIKKVKIVPIKERFSIFNPNKIIGVANTQPNIYKKGINIIVDNNFGLKKNNLKNKFFIFLKTMVILK